MADQEIDAALPSPATAGWNYTPSFPAILMELRAALLVTTYQAGKLIVLRAAGTEIRPSLRSFDRAMGVAVDRQRLALGTRNQIWFFERDNLPLDGSQHHLISGTESSQERGVSGGAAGGDLEPPVVHSPVGLPVTRADAHFLPRYAHVTGDIRVHELAWLSGGELWIVNTRFSCLCTLDGRHSFVPRWWPPFISKLEPEDRCHLNGLAVQDGQLCYVSALAISDEREGWRQQRATGGVILQVPGGEVVAANLAMPHSPRLYEGKLWVLESGRGRLLKVDPDQSQGDIVTELPGYVRGLALAGGYAFVGLSRVRPSRTFAGLPISGDYDRHKSGVWVVELATGRTVAQLEFQRQIREIFDVQLLPGVQFPSIYGLRRKTLNKLFVLPGENNQK